MSMSNYLAKELLDHVFGGGNRNFVSPTKLYVFTSRVDPGEFGLGLSEPSDAAYLRRSCKYSDFDVAHSDATHTTSDVGLHNAVEFAFPQSTEAQGTITHFGITDSSDLTVNGNVLGSGTLTTPKAIASSTIVRFNASDLTFYLD